MNWHKQSIGAHGIVFRADLNVLVVVHAFVLEPDRSGCADSLLLSSRDG